MRSPARPTPRPHLEFLHPGLDHLPEDLPAEVRDAGGREDPGDHLDPSRRGGHDLGDPVGGLIEARGVEPLVVAGDARPVLPLGPQHLEHLDRHGGEGAGLDLPDHPRGPDPDHAAGPAVQEVVQVGLALHHLRHRRIGQVEVVEHLAEQGGPDELEVPDDVRQALPVELVGHRDRAETREGVAVRHLVVEDDDAGGGADRQDLPHLGVPVAVFVDPQVALVDPDPAPGLVGPVCKTDVGLVLVLVPLVALVLPIGRVVGLRHQDELPRVAHGQ
jgi:hypothetical protein